MGVAGVLSFLLAAGFATAGGANPQTPQIETAKAAGMPQIENGKVEQRQVKAGLAQEVDVWAAASQQAQWLGYSVPAVEWRSQDVLRRLRRRLEWRTRVPVPAALKA